ncbi:hypothetical protein [Chiayiivirga flava]|uniref:Uncharacterized protein n=1 Tax=Chiayiivirga flava TaxID=659595 RepID=A0A7W8G053_9GAMM|nr:hypothetical protein [Chiayiivirga flava]MBB5207894.1 hypothetical protein [Chiayiivirga flava]
MKKYIAIPLVFFFCTGGESRAGADLSFSFVPQPATESDIVSFRVDFVGCFDSPVQVFVDHQQRMITATIESSDVACDETNPDNYVSPVAVQVGLLPAGIYDTQVVVCGILAPPPEPSCSVIEEGMLVVTSNGRLPATVPTTSGIGQAILLLLMLLAGVEVIRRR